MTCIRSDRNGSAPHGQTDPGSPRRAHDRVDPLRPTDRLSHSGNGDITHVFEAFNAMLDRLELTRYAVRAGSVEP